MDLNQLFYHHQIAVMRAAGQCSRDPEAACLVEHYRRRLRESFVASGAPARDTSAWNEVAA